MIKKMAWNTFKNTGDVNTFLELKQIQNVEEQIGLQIKQPMEEQNGNNKNEWYNIAEEFCGDHSIVISGIGYYSSESKATSVGFTNITTTSENGYLTIKAKYNDDSQLLSNLRNDTDYIVLRVLHYFGTYPVYTAVSIRVPLKVLETVTWRLEKVTE